MMTRECARCGSDAFVDVTTFDRLGPQLICAICGARYVHQFAAPVMGRMHGPSVPTPADILDAAEGLIAWP